MLTISGKKDETKLRLLADRQRYKVGEEASVNLHSRDRAGTALLTWEADRILSYKIVTLKEGDNTVAWAIDGPQFPNFTLTSTRMWRNECDQARLDIQVERDLRVTVAPTKPIVGPGEAVELEVTTVDQLGRPVAAELSIAMVDQSLLRLFHDRLPAIGPFFYNQTRTGAFATETTNTFRYAPATVPVSQAVVDEAERAAAVAANEAERQASVMDQAQDRSAIGTRRMRPAATRSGFDKAAERGHRQRRNPEASPQAEEYGRSSVEATMRARTVDNAGRRTGERVGNGRTGRMLGEQTSKKSGRRGYSDEARDLPVRTDSRKAGRELSPANDSPRPPTGTRSSSPARTARPASRSRPRRLSRPTASWPAASPAPTLSPARRRRH